MHSIYSYICIYRHALGPTLRTNHGPPDAGGAWGPHEHVIISPDAHRGASHGPAVGLCTL